MVTSDLERMLDDWAMVWSSAENNDPERVLSLFADDCVFEDVTFGLVARGKKELSRFRKQSLCGSP